MLPQHAASPYATGKTVPRTPDAGQFMFFPFRYKFISMWSYETPCKRTETKQMG